MNYLEFNIVVDRKYMRYGFFVGDFNIGVVSVLIIIKVWKYV